MGKLSKLLDEIREDGIEVIFRKLSWRLPRSIFYFNHSNHLCFDLKQFKPSKLPDLEVRMAEFEDFRLFNKINIREETFNHRLARGDTCTMVVVDGLVRAFMWATSGNVYIRNCGAEMDVGDDGFYAFDAYTDPEYRGKGFFKYCDVIQNQYYLDHGKPYHYGSIDKFNKLSNMIRQKAGYKIIGETINYSIFSLNFTFFKNWYKKTPALRIFGNGSVKHLKHV